MSGADLLVAFCWGAGCWVGTGIVLALGFACLGKRPK